MAKTANNLKVLKFNKNNLKAVIRSSGVYLFKNSEGKVLYVGKANDLKARLQSYLAINLTPKTKKLLDLTEYFSFIKVNSEIEALLLEASLTKKLQPKFNISLKDDKSPLYIRITKEKYPKVTTARKIEEDPPPGGRNIAFYGPFPSSVNVKSVLKMMRRIFPYSDHRIGKRGCIYSQISLCEPCPNEIEKNKSITKQKEMMKKYIRNIHLIKGVLDGRIVYVRKKLKTEMDRFSKQERFEDAKMIRDEIRKLDYITQPIVPISKFIKNPNLIEDIRTQESETLRKFIKKQINLSSALKRIECYDVAHLAGTNPAASMVTFVNGEPDKSLYRRFKIRQTKGNSDTDSLREVAKRRIGHLSTWGAPDLIIVDGGRAQVGVFRKYFGEKNIPVVGLSKRFDSLVIPVEDKKLMTKSFVERVVPRGPARNLVQRIRDEAHRFARAYHHKLLQKEFIPSKSKLY